MQKNAFEYIIGDGENKMIQDKKTGQELVEKEVVTENGENDTNNVEEKKGLQQIKDKAEDFAIKVAEVADDGMSWARDKAELIKERISKEIDKRDLAKYGPVYKDDISDKHLPDMINVTLHDKAMDITKYKEAVAFDRSFKEGNVLVLKRNEALLFPVTFSPSLKEGVYYVHPIDKSRYIELDDYFTTLQAERVAELRDIAQALGATHFSVTIKEEKTAITRVDVKAKGKVKVGKEHVEDQMDKTTSAKEYSFIGIADKSDFAGKAPVKPELCLWKNNPQINSLIKLRMDKDSPLLKTSYTLNYNTSSGIKVKEAGKVAGLLKQLKFEGAASIVKEAEKESKRVLEYEIEFKPY